MKRWEYRVEGMFDWMHDDSLNTLGAQGWELITIERAGSGEWRRYIFKRRLRHKPQQVR